MKKRNINMDLIKCIAVFSVISVHFFANVGLYKNVINCAITAGIVRRNTSGRIFPCSNCTVISCCGFCICNIILLASHKQFGVFHLKHV